MKTVYKYEIKPEDFGALCRIEMPCGSTVLAVGEQCEKLCMWVEVDTDEPPVGRLFQVYGTGHPHRTTLDDEQEYRGTCFLHFGALVLHVYEYTGV